MSTGKEVASSYERVRPCVVNKTVGFSKILPWESLYNIAVVLQPRSD